MTAADLAYQAALDRLASVGFDALTEWERDLAVLWQVEAGVGNGGLAHYYSGPAGNHAWHVPGALARVGAAAKSAILRDANAFFGPSGPPRDREARRAALKVMDPHVRTALDEMERRYVEDPVDVDEAVELVAAAAEAGRDAGLPP